MQPTIVIAHTSFGDDLAVERAVLRPLNANLVHTGNLTEPDALAAVEEAAASQRLRGPPRGHHYLAGRAGCPEDVLTN